MTRRGSEKSVRNDNSWRQSRYFIYGRQVCAGGLCAVYGVSTTVFDSVRAHLKASDDMYSFILLDSYLDVRTVKIEKVVFSESTAIYFASAIHLRFHYYHSSIPLKIIAIQSTTVT